MTVPAPVISFGSSSTSPFVSHALDLIAHFCGVRFTTIDAPVQVDVYYGNDNERPCRIRIPLVDRYTVSDVPRVPAATRSRDAPSSNDPFPFDLFAALRFWLADEGNATKSANDFDEHQRLRGTRSAQDFIGLREIPVVNHYLLLLRDWIKRRLAVRTTSPLPSGKRCVVLLSHDVDRPVNPTRPAHIFRVAGRALVHGKNRIRALRYGLVAAAQAVDGFTHRPTPRRWLFHQVAEAEEDRGFRSTFFFAATSRFADQGHPLDVAYDVSAPEFQRVCRELRARGCEIGLHIGYSVTDRADRLVEEKQLLERVVGAEVSGSRHHYWHMGYPFWPALEAHEQAGLRYDSSIGFNDIPGFRLGIAFPYRPWSPASERAIRTFQIPVMGMDRSYVGKRNESVERTLTGVQRLVDELKRCEGVAALNWHQELSLPTSSESQTSGTAYLALLDLLAADPEVAVQTFPEVVVDAEGRFTPDLH